MNATLLSLTVFLVSYGAHDPQATSGVKAKNADKPVFAGKWTFNADKSETLRDKMRSSGRSGDAPPGDGSGAGTGGDTGHRPPPGAGGGGGHGGGGRGGMHGGGFAAPRGPSDAERELIQDMLADVRKPAETLTITQDGADLTIQGTEGEARKYNLGGKTTKREKGGIQDRAHWDGDRIVVESKVGDFAAVSATYYMSLDRKQLTVIWKMENARLGTPVTIRQIYDLASVD